MRTKSEIKNTLKKAAAESGNQYAQILYGTAELRLMPSGLYKFEGRSSEKWFNEQPFIEEYEQTFTSKRKALEYAYYIHCGREHKAGGKTLVMLIVEDMTASPTYYLNFSNGKRDQYEWAV